MSDEGVYSGKMLHPWNEIKAQGKGDPAKVAAHKAAMEEDIRIFESGATRDTDEGKIDPEAALSPLVVRRYCEFKASQREQKDGSTRPDDQWQLGIPLDSYMKSLSRHHLDVWLLHRGHETREDMETALCSLIFNASGYLHSLLIAEEK